MKHRARIAVTVASRPDQEPRIEPPIATPVVPAALREALFAAVLAHDTIDLDATLPDTVPLEFGPNQFARFFAVARAVWTHGVDRRVLSRVAVAAIPGQPLGPGDGAAFRDIRARFKQLRFAYVMFARAHDYPPALHRITRVMGHLQDALKHGRRGQAAARALQLRLLATPGSFARIVREMDRFRPSDRASFRAYVDREMDTVRATLASPLVTARRFHETRKVVSRLVAMFDCVDTIEPSPEHRATVRYLGTINGLMGGLHDDMIARRMNGTQDYDAATFPLAVAVAERLRRLERALGTPAAASRQPGLAV